MKERVDGKILQQALDDLVPRFPTLMVTIKRGAFWYYFERLPFKPQVEKETLYSFQPIPLDGKRYLFRVVYSDYRIGCEFFHSITDGTGGSTFLMSLLARYYEIKTGKAISDFKSAKTTAICQPQPRSRTVFRFMPKSTTTQRGTSTLHISRNCPRRATAL